MLKRSGNPDFSGLKCNVNPEPTGLNRSESPNLPGLARSKSCPQNLRQVIAKTPYLFSIFFLSILFSCQYHIFSQEEPLTAFKWYYCPRAFPYDTISGGAFDNAVTQKKALLQSLGYQFQASEHWEPIGPLPFGYNTASSGRIHHVVYDPGDPSEDGSGRVIYVTGASGGLWKTTDGGVIWNDKSGDLPSLSSGAFTISYVNNIKILYFGCGGGSPPFFGDGRSMGIFSSTNDGTNWIRISNGLVHGSYINKIVVSPLDPTGNTMFAATSHGLYKTTNGGGLWIKVIPEKVNVNLICTDVCFSPDYNKVYAVGPSIGHQQPYAPLYDGIGYWRSDDGGNTFDPVTQESSSFPHGDNVICERVLCAVSKADNAEELVWFITFDQLDNNVDVYKSTDYGQSFSSRVVDDNSHTRFQLVLRPSDTDPYICFAGSERLYRTTNGGETTTDWTCQSGYCGYPTHADFLALDFNPFNPQKVTAGNDGGVFSSTDLGTTWVTRNQYLGSFALLWGLATSTYDANFVAGGLHDFGYGINENTEPGSTYWNDVNFGADGGNMMASPFKSKHFVGNKVYGCRVIDYYNGTSFQSANGYRCDMMTSVENAPFAHHPTEPGVVYTVRYKPSDLHIVDFRKSTNYGADWGGDNTPWRYIITPPNLTGAPYLISISPSNPETIIMNIGAQNEFFLSAFDIRSKLIKSTNGGLNWHDEENPPDPITPIVYGGKPGSGLPNRSFTDIEFDPVDENVLYLTVSGYYYPNNNEGHVFKSTDGGYNWSNISSNLPDIPVSDLIIHYKGSGSNDKELIIATDAGIYVYDAMDNNWRELALDFPNTTAFHLDYNRLSGKLRTNTWGRGAWEFQLDQSTIYVQDRLYITDNVTLDKQIVVAPGGKLILGHSATGAFEVNFTSDKKITVMDGGSIEASSGVAITLTSPGSWGGIEIQGNSSHFYLKNITFQNTETPIVVNGAISDWPGLEMDKTIEDCIFTNAPIQLTNRSKVKINSCDWTFTGGPNTDAVVAIGGDFIYVSGNNINYTTPLDGSHAIQLSQCSHSLISSNTINNSSYPITVSNGISHIFKNTLSSNTASISYTGIELSGVSEGQLTQNEVNGYQAAYKFDNLSSLPVLENTASGSNEYGESSAIYCYNQASPRLVPSDDGEGNFLWDAGKNVMLNESSQGSGMFVSEYSAPLLDYGYNTIFGTAFYITGDNYPYGEFFVRCNSWNEDPPVDSKFYIPGVTFYYDPYNCVPPEGGGGKTGELNENPDPPQPLIVDYGNGFIDTIVISHSNIQQPADRQMLGQAKKLVYTGNFPGAVDKYKQLIQQYQDSITAIQALNGIFYCYARLNADTLAYHNLRTYYINLASQNSSDTVFSKTAYELSRKCYVMKKEFADAMTQYEYVVQNSHDSTEIIPAEISIIELYIMTANGGGDAPGFTGQLGYLKPLDMKGALRMIRQKLNHSSGHVNTVNIPSVFSLSQNYPNPFNPITKINFSLPNPSKVSIKIYDILGRTVKVLVNEFRDKGIHTITFDGTGLASGVYFYSIEAGNFKDTKKMVLIK